MNLLDSVVRNVLENILWLWKIREIKVINFKIKMPKHNHFYDFFRSEKVIFDFTKKNVKKKWAAKICVFLTQPLKVLNVIL